MWLAKLKTHIQKTPNAKDTPIEKLYNIYTEKWLLSQTYVSLWKLKIVKIKILLIPLTKNLKHCSEKAAGENWKDWEQIQGLPTAEVSSSQVFQAWV